MRHQFNMSNFLGIIVILIALSACAQTASTSAASVNGLPTNISPAASSN